MLSFILGKNESNASISGCIRRLKDKLSSSKYGDVATSIKDFNDIVIVIKQSSTDITGKINVNYHYKLCDIVTKFLIESISDGEYRNKNDIKSTTDAALLDIVTSILLCVKNFNSRKFFNAYANIIHFRLLGILEERKFSIVTHKELLLCILTCVQTIAVNISISSFSLTRYFLLCSMMASSSNESLCLYLECAIDILHCSNSSSSSSNKIILLGRCLESSFDANATASSNTSCSSKKINIDVKKYFMSLSHTSISAQPSGVVQLRISSTSPSSNDSFALNRLVLRGIFSNIYSCSNNSSITSSSSTSSSNDSLHRNNKSKEGKSVIPNMSKAYNKFIYQPLTRKNSKEPKDDTRASSVDNQKRISNDYDGFIYWPPLNTGYSMSVWFMISDCHNNSSNTSTKSAGNRSSNKSIIVKNNLSSLKYILCEISSDAQYPNLKLYVNSDKRVVLDIDLIDSDNVLQKKEMMFNHLPIVTQDVWHFIYLKHNLITDAPTVSVSLDGCLSNEEICPLPVSNHYSDSNKCNDSSSSSSDSNSNSSSSQGCKVSNYSVMCGLSADTSKILSMEYMLQINSLTVMNAVLSKDEVEIIYGCGPLHIYSNSHRGYSNDAFNDAHFQVPYCSPNALEDTFHCSSTGNNGHFKKADPSSYSRMPPDSDGSTNAPKEDFNVHSSPSKGGTRKAAVHRSSGFFGNGALQSDALKEMMKQTHKYTASPSTILVSINGRCHNDGNNTVYASSGISKKLYEIYFDGQVDFFSNSHNNCCLRPTPDHILNAIHLMYVCANQVSFAFSLRILSLMLRSASSLSSSFYRDDSKLFIDHLIIFVLKLKASQGLCLDISHMIFDLMTDITNDRNPMQNEVHMWSNMYHEVGYDPALTSHERNVVVTRSRLLSICSSLFLPSLDVATLGHLLHGFKSLLYAPFERYHPINKLQLTGAQSFRSMLLTLLDPKLLYDHVISILETLSSMIRADYVTDDDHCFLVNMTCTFIVDARVSMHDKDCSIVNDTRGVDKSTRKQSNDKHRSTVKSSTASALLSRFKIPRRRHSRSRDVKRGNELDGCRFNVLRVDYPQQFMLVRQGLLSLLLDCANWAYATSSQNEVLFPEKAAFAFTARPSEAPLHTPFTSSINSPFATEVESSSSTCHGRASSSEDVNFDNNSDFTASIGASKDPKLLHTYLDTVTVGAGLKGMTNLCNIFTIDMVLHCLFHLSDLKAYHSIATFGALAYRRQHDDPFSSLLLLQYMSLMVWSYKKTLLRKLSYVKEVEVYTVAMYRNSLFNFPSGHVNYTMSSPSQDEKRISKYFQIAFTSTGGCDNKDQSITPTKVASVHHSSLNDSIYFLNVNSVDSSSRSHTDTANRLSYSTLSDTMVKSSFKSKHDSIDTFMSNKIELIIRTNLYLFDELLGGIGRGALIMKYLADTWGGNVFDPVYRPLDQVHSLLVNSVASDCSMSLLLSILNAIKEAARLATMEAFFLQITSSSTSHEPSPLGGYDSVDIIKESCLLSKSVAVTLLCALNCLLRESTEFQYKMRTTPSSIHWNSTVDVSPTAASGGIATTAGKNVKIANATTGSSSSSNGNSSSSASSSSISSSNSMNNAYNPTTYIEEVICHVVQVFYSSSISYMVEVLKQDDDFVACFTPTKTSDGDPSIDISTQEWLTVPREVINRCCSNTIGRLCIEFLTTIIKLTNSSKRSNGNAKESSSKDSSNKDGNAVLLDWEKALSMPPMPSNPPVPSMISVSISYALNLAVRRKLIDSYCSKEIDQYDSILQQSPLSSPLSSPTSSCKSPTVTSTTSTTTPASDSILPFIGRLLEQLAEYELAQLKLHRQFQPDPDGRVISSFALVARTIERAAMMHQRFGSNTVVDGLLRSTSTISSVVTAIGKLSSSLGTNSSSSGSGNSASYTALALASLRNSTIALLKFADHNDELLTVKMLQFVACNGSIMFQLNDNDDEFAQTIACLLYLLLYEDSDQLRSSSIIAWSSLLASPLIDYVRSFFIVPYDGSNKSSSKHIAGLLKGSKPTVDLWMYGSGGFHLLQKLSDSASSTSDSSISNTVTVANDSSSNDTASVTSINPAIEFQSWLASLPEKLRIALTDKLSSTTSKSKLNLRGLVSRSNTKRSYECYLGNDFAAAAYEEKWLPICERYMYDGQDLLSYLSDCNVIRRKLFDTITRYFVHYDITDVEGNAHSTNLGMIYYYSMQRKIDSIALKTSLYGTISSRSSSYSQAVNSNTDTEVSILLNCRSSLCTPPSLLHSFKDHEPWVRTRIGATALGLSENITSAGSTIAPNVVLAEKNIIGSESGSDGTLMALCVMIREDSMGEWSLSSVEGPGRVRIKIKRGNLSLLRIKGPQLLAKEANAKRPSFIMAPWGGNNKTTSEEKMKEDTKQVVTRKRISESPLKLTQALFNALKESMDMGVEDDVCKDNGSNTESVVTDDAYLLDDDVFDDDDASDYGRSISEVFSARGGKKSSIQKYRSASKQDKSLMVERMLLGEEIFTSYSDEDDDEADEGTGDEAVVEEEEVGEDKGEFGDGGVDVFTESVDRKSSRMHRDSDDMHETQTQDISSSISSFIEKTEAAVSVTAMATPLNNNGISVDTQSIHTSKNAHISLADLADVKDDAVHTNGSSKHLYVYLMYPSESVELEYDCIQVVGMDKLRCVCITSAKRVYLIWPDSLDILTSIVNSDNLFEVCVPRKSRAKSQDDTRLNNLLAIYQASMDAIGKDNNNTMVSRNHCYTEVTSVQKRCYLLIDKGIEIFFSNGRSTLLVLNDTVSRDQLLNSLLVKCPHALKNLLGVSSLSDQSTTGGVSISGGSSHHNSIDRGMMTGTAGGRHYPIIHPHTTVYMPWNISNTNSINAGTSGDEPKESMSASSLSSSSLTAKMTTFFQWSSQEFDTITEKWLNGNLTNFDYLMHLNTVAGRSYNDWSCYPVFPWILMDYNSQTLDLNDHTIFRDLSKPMGAISSVREKEAKERFQSLIQSPNISSHADGGCPPYHYGTHYSSSAVVLHYLLRLQPFSSNAIALQAGRFDRPDRIFNSIGRSWMSASGGLTRDPATATANLQDVKELVPEFFYCPDFLCNINGYEMGTASIRQSVVNRIASKGGNISNITEGLHVIDVELPPWAKGNAREFIRSHRAALESDYVSANLHAWIDLIFGYKQLGKSAEDAYNCYHFLSYQGIVDIDALPSASIRRAYEEQRRDFGQTPAQLFKVPHPRKKCTTSWLIDDLEQMQAIGPRHVTVVTTSDILLQLEGVRVLSSSNKLYSDHQFVHRGSFDDRDVWRNSSADSNDVMDISSIVGPCINHRSVAQIHVDNDNCIHAINTGCVLLAPYYDSLFAIGYLDASLKSACKVVSVSNDSYRVIKTPGCLDIPASDDWVIAGSVDVAGGAIFTAIAVSEDASIVITGQNVSCNIYVWKRSKGSSNSNTANQSPSLSASVMHDGGSEYVMAEVLCASHVNTGVLNILAISTPHRIVLSACSHGCVGLWDLDTLSGIHLDIDTPTDVSDAGNKDYVRAIEIDKITGDIYVAVLSTMYIFDVNGRRLCKVDYATIANSVDSSSERHENRDVLSICVCPFVSWQEKRGFFTGHANGSIVFWTTHINVADSSISDSASSSSSGGNESSYKFSSTEYTSSKCFEIEDAFGGSGIAVTAITVTKDMKTLVAGSSEGTICEWSLCNYKRK